MVQAKVDVSVHGCSRSSSSSEEWMELRQKVIKEKGTALR